MSSLCSSQSGFLPSTVFAVVLLSLVSPSTMRAQSTAALCTENADQFGLITVVPLNGTGIGDWRFLNPRLPYPVVRKRDGYGAVPASEPCFQRYLPEASVVFENQTSDRVFDVKLKLTLPSAQALLGGMVDRLAAAGTPPPSGLSPAGLSVTEIPQQVEEIREQIGRLEGIRDEAGRQRASSARDIEFYQKRLDRSASRPAADESALAAAQARHEAARKEEEEASAEIGRLNAELADLDLLDNLDLSAEDRDRLLMALGLGEIQDAAAFLDELRKIRRLRDSAAAGAPGPLDPVLSRCREAVRSLPTDRLATGSEVNKFRADCLLPLATNLLTPRANEQEEALIGRLCTDKVSAVSGDGMYLAAACELAQGFGVVAATGALITAELGAAPSEKALKSLCETKDRSLSCVINLNLPPQQRKSVPGALLARAAVLTEAFKFDVSFALDPDIPPQKTGFLALVPVVKEPPSSSLWAFSGAIGASRDPDPVVDPDNPDRKIYSSDHPYAGDRRKQMTGAGSLSLAQTLGNRATGSVILDFKSGALGATDSSGTLKASDYKLLLFGDNGVRLQFGKTTYTANAASNEKGEGLELGWRSLGLGYLARRESAAGVANDANQDHRLYFFKADNLGLGRGVPFFARMSLIFLYGNDKDPGDDKRPSKAGEYGTLGGRVSFGAADLNLAGDLQAFYSRRRPDGPVSTLVEGDGFTAVLSTTYSRIVREHGTVSRPWSASFQIGYGTGDDPQTPEDESYLGETAGFAPDRLFLKTFAGRIGEIGEDGKERALIGPGLSNKLYTGARFTLSTFSPLEALARITGARDAVAAKSSAIVFHHYRFNDPVFGSREAGNELGLETSIQIPRGVTATLGLGWFFVGEAVQDVFLDDEPWVATLSIAAKLD